MGSIQTKVQSVLLHPLPLTLSMPHMTIVTINCLVKKVPSQELLHAIEFSMRLV